MEMRRTPMTAMMLATVAMALGNIRIPPAFTLPGFAPQGKAPLKITTGRYYPHSSKRQRARYARQIASGQIKNAA